MKKWLEERLRDTVLWKIIEWVEDRWIFAERREVISPIIETYFDHDQITWNIRLPIIPLNEGIPITLAIWNQLRQNSWVKIRYLVTKIRHRYYCENIEVMETK
jgi:hypothetical protein